MCLCRYVPYVGTPVGDLDALLSALAPSSVGMIRYGKQSQATGKIVGPTRIVRLGAYCSGHESQVGEECICSFGVIVVWFADMNVMSKPVWIFPGTVHRASIGASLVRGISQQI